MMLAMDAGTIEVHVAVRAYRVDITHEVDITHPTLIVVGMYDTVLAVLMGIRITYEAGDTDNG